MAFDLKDYVDVAERKTMFAEKYPEGSFQADLTPMLDPAGVLIGWLCRAYAYRSPDDGRPGVGHAFEPVPGKTPYTRDSEAQNAETAAWGRAILAVGFSSKHIASKQEVLARQEEPPPPAAKEKKPARDPKFASERQTARLWALAKENGVDEPALRSIILKFTGQESGAAIPKDLYDRVCVGVQTYRFANMIAEPDGEDVPFE